MKKEWSIQLENRPGDLNKLNRFLDDFSRSHSLDSHVRQIFRLCLEEIFTNILRYAFEDDRRHRIDFHFRYENNSVIISIMDDGIPFNPLTNPRPDIQAAIQDRQVGGLGIHLIRSLMDRVSYDHKDNKNILTIKKGINGYTSGGG